MRLARGAKCGALGTRELPSRASEASSVPEPSHPAWSITAASPREPIPVPTRLNSSRRDNGA